MVDQSKLLEMNLFLKMMVKLLVLQVIFQIWYLIIKNNEDSIEDKDDYFTNE